MLIKNQKQNPTQSSSITECKSNFQSGTGFWCGTHHEANLSIAERRHHRVLSTLIGSVLLEKSRFSFVGHVKIELLDERKVCGVERVGSMGAFSYSECVCVALPMVYSKLMGS